MRLFNYVRQNLNDNIQIHTNGCEACMSDAYNFACTLPLNEMAIVLNTCSFIEDRAVEAQLLEDLLHRAYPYHKMYVLGCDVNNKGKYVSKTFTNEEVAKIIKDRDVISKDKVTIDKHRVDPNINIKVQDGCMFNCTYCIINKLRNNPTSVPYREIVKLIKEQISLKEDYLKVVLAGTEIATYYDKETGYKISDVLEHLIEDLPEVTRISLTALDPAQKETEKVIRIIGKYPEKFVPHLLIAVQSGSDEILKAMKRRHDVARVRYLHQIAKECNVSLGWDIIIGFPGETEEMFMETYNLMAELMPLTQNIFMYSDREGTPASKLPNHLPTSVIEDRNRRAHELMFKYANEHKDLYDNFNEYAEEALSNEYCMENKYKALALLDEGNYEIDVDIYNKNEVAHLVSSHNLHCVVHVNYNLEDDLYSEIIINFIKQNMRSMPIIVHVTKDFSKKYNIKDFERVFQCIIMEDL